VTETKAHRKIREAVEQRGGELRELTWEPWGIAAEKCGIPGGWRGEYRSKEGDIMEIMGLSWQEAIEDLASWDWKEVRP
jgi:hypothetical protein